MKWLAVGGEGNDKQMLAAGGCVVLCTTKNIKQTLDKQTLDKINKHCVV